MSGICGGRKGEVGIGTLIVPEMCWNYQTGKFKNGSLQFEPNSVSIPTNVYTILSQFLANSQAMESLHDGFIADDVFKYGETTQPLVSGSSVLADASAIDEIGLQHRKVAGVDMEMYSIFRASTQFYESSAVFFGAKTVVDLADDKKSDKYHEYGCIVSARFVAGALKKLLID
jgi:adenosylhomocysteine nucleosidase